MNFIDQKMNFVVNDTWSLNSC